MVRERAAPAPVETMKYIAFEGIDGAGKGTQIELLCAWLVKRYYTPITLCEPTYGQYGAEVRKRWLADSDFSRDEQIRLFTLDRREHVEAKVRPLLEFVERHPFFLIVQDRYYLSGPAYQAEGKKTMIELLRSQQNIAPKPDIIFLIDVSVETAVERIAMTEKRSGVFERSEVLERARKNYLFLAGEGSERIKVIDGGAPPEDVSAQIIETLSDGLAQNDKT